MIVRDIDELMVLNDEAHHIHDPTLAWFKSIEDIHNRLLQKGAALSLQVDVTATPKHNNGAIFVQTVADYPLVEAISQNVVKHPVLPDAASRAKLQERQSAKYTEKYADYIDLGVIEWRKAYAEHEKLGKKAILFVMTDDTRNCDDVAEYLEGRYPDLQGRGAGHPHQEQRRDFRGSHRARPRKNWKSCASRPTRSTTGQPLQGHRLGADAQRRLGRAQRHHHRRPAGLFAPRAISCRSRRWGAACARCIPAAWRNMSASSARTPSWISWSRSRPRASNWNARRWAKAPSRRRRWSSRSITRTTRRTSTRWISRSRC